MFKFKINNDEWLVEEKNKDELREMYENETEEKTFFVFGVTQKSKHIIYINQDMCEEQKIWSYVKLVRKHYAKRK